MLTLFGRELLTPAGVLPAPPQSTSFLAMPAAGPVGNPHQQSARAGLAISFALHIAAAASVLYLQQVRPLFPQHPVTRVPPRLVSLAYVPEIPLELPVLPRPTPLPPAKLQVRTEEPRPEVAKLLPTAPEHVQPIDIGTPKGAPYVPAAGTPKGAPYVPAAGTPKGAPYVPAPYATVIVGAFPNNAAVRTPQPNREVEKVAFDAPSERATAPKSAITTLGGFDRPVLRDAKADTQRPVDAVVAKTGFAAAPAAAPAAPESRVVRETGFGDTNSRERPRPAEPVAVTPSGFANARESQTVAKTAPPPQPTIIPVEVLSKPTPTYTDEARKLKIEGEVLLEVEFVSTGSVRVLRVVRGLGHGLDEAAARAAEQIKFKPAQDSGRPVDFRTTVHIVFRLA